MTLTDLGGADAALAAVDGVDSPVARAHPRDPPRSEQRRRELPGNSHVESDVVGIDINREPSDMQHIDGRVQRGGWWLSKASHFRVQEDEARPGAPSIPIAHTVVAVRADLLRTSIVTPRDLPGPHATDNV